LLVEPNITPTPPTTTTTTTTTTNYNYFKETDEKERSLRFDKKHVFGLNLYNPETADRGTLNNQDDAIHTYSNTKNAHLHFFA